jgi:hypothetical protein
MLRRFLRRFGGIRFRAACRSLKVSVGDIDVVTNINCRNASALAGATSASEQSAPRKPVNASMTWPQTRRLAGL